MKLTCSTSTARAAVRSRAVSVAMCISRPTPASSRSSEHSRRGILGGIMGGVSLLTLVQDPAPAEARTAVGMALGEAWKNVQRQNGGMKILAPIRGAIEKLTEGGALLEVASTPEELTAALKTIRGSSLNCYVFEALPTDDFATRASLATQQIITTFMTTADPCTFRIIVKNVTSLSSPATQQEGKDIITTIVQSYNLLDSYLEQGINGIADKVEEARKQLVGTLSLVKSLDAFVVSALAEPIGSPHYGEATKEMRDY
eukprot:gene18004-24413_t